MHRLRRATAQVLWLVAVSAILVACGSSGDVEPVSEAPEPAATVDDQGQDPSEEDDVVGDDIEIDVGEPMSEDPEPPAEPEPAEPPPLFVPVELTLESRDGSRFGRAIVTADGDPKTGRTVVALLLDEQATTRAAGVLRGSCGGPGEPAFDLGQVFSGISTATLAIPLRELQDGGFKIVVRRGERPDGAVAGCVEIPPADET